jgi:hypothetical protein
VNRNASNFGIRAVAAITLLVLTFGVHALRAQDPQNNSAPDHQPPKDDAPREIIYPYYSLRDGADSTLQMMDRSPWPIEFTVAVHGTSGQTLLAKPMTINPDDPLDVNIREVLRDLGADTQGDFAEGSVSLHFKGKGNPLGGRMIVTGKSETWNLGPIWRENESGYSMIPEQLNTFWWELGGSRDAEISVDNIADEDVSADLFLEFQGKRHAAPQLRFAPHELKRISVTQVLAQMGLTAYQAPYGGVSIISHSPQPVLVAQGLLTDTEVGRKNGLTFPLPQMQIANALHATGIPISVPRADSPFAGTGNYTPHIIVRNLLNTEQTVTVTVEYPGENGPRQTLLDPIKINAYTTQDIRLDSYYSRLPLPLPYCAVRIQYNGPPGSLISEGFTVEEDTARATYMGLRNEGDGYAASLSSYWSISDKKDFYIFFTNMSDEKCRIAFRLDADDVKYFLPHLVLNPHETTYLSLREMRDRQEPDGLGHKIPATATEGRLFYNRMDNVPIIGRVMELPRRK